MTTDTVGGVWTYTTELAGELLKQGVAVALVAIGRRPSAVQQQWLQQTSAQWGRCFQWDACEASLEWAENNDGAYRDAAPLLLQVARAWQADLLHSNQFCFGAMAGSLPVLVVAHSDVLSWATACRGKNLEASPWLDIYTRLTSTGLQNASAVAAPTHWMLAALRERFSFTCQARVISNGRTIGVPAAGPTRKLQAVTAGRLWDEAKNLTILRGLQAPFPILVAGETEYESQNAILFSREIQMLGPLPEEELLALFRQSSIYLCTSVYEPFGLAPLEAALCGCAVVANDIPSLREVWGEGAIYFHDKASLQDRLTELARDPRQLAAAQHRSVRRAQNYEAARMAGQYLDLYQTMLTRREAASHVA